MPEQLFVPLGFVDSCFAPTVILNDFLIRQILWQKVKKQKVLSCQAEVIFGQHAGGTVHPGFMAAFIGCTGKLRVTVVYLLGLQMSVTLIHLLITALAGVATYRAVAQTKGWPELICALLLWGSLACLLVGETNATIDGNGALHEVGMLLPLGAVMLIAGTIGLAAFWILGSWRAVQR